MRSYITKHVRKIVPECRCRAFTLIELLVVIAIIALLTTLLIPTLKRSLEGGRTAKCLSNLKQLSAMVYLYAGDHDGLLPEAYEPPPPGVTSGVVWYDLLEPYDNSPRKKRGHRSVWSCPSFKLYWGTLYHGNYAMSDRFIDPVALSRVPKPASTAYLLDGYSKPDNKTAWSLYYIGRLGNFNFDGKDYYYHNDGVNVLFVGGNAARFSREEARDQWRDWLLP